MLKELDIEMELKVDRRAQARRATTKRRFDEGDSVQSENNVDQAVSEDIEEAPTERRKVERRRQIDPTTCERDYSGDEIEFMRSMDDYKRRSGRQFPTWSEVLEVLKDMGYRKIAEPTTTYTPEDQKVSQD
ncbi:MAG: hypothetical protein JKY95_05885 [Planctomycetaceae bacterium]|nr:hypothetical protein [Planctomycetaceae bacterium]